MALLRDVIVPSDLSQRILLHIPGDDRRDTVTLAPHSIRDRLPEVFKAHKSRTLAIPVCVEYCSAVSNAFRDLDNPDILESA